jgi:S1-C subfamily serine protease
MMDMDSYQREPPQLSWWARFGPLVLLLLLLGGILLWRFMPLQWSSGPITDPNAKPREITPPAGLLANELAYIQVNEKARKSVVSITTLGYHRNPINFDVEEVPEGAGSGFVWDDEKGYIVTNFHVVQDAQAAEVTLWDGSTQKARVVGQAPDKDLAVLKIPVTAKLQKIEVGTSRDLKVGQLAFAIGNPFAVGVTFTQGVISGLNRKMKSVTGRPIDNVLQTSAAINPGNSGGPLLDSSGRLIGVNTAIYSPSGANAGIGFAIPVDTVNQVVPELIRRGKVERPGLGVQIATPQLVRKLGVKKGVLIVEIVPKGPAANAALHGTKVDQRGKITQMGDVIVAIDGKPISSVDDLYEALANHKVGDVVKVTVLRDDETRDVDVALEPI